MEYVFYAVIALVLVALIRTFTGEDHRQAMFCARVSGALFDLGIQALKLDQKEYLRRAGEAFQNQQTPQEAALLILTDPDFEKPEAALRASLDVVFRQTALLAVKWMKEGEVSEEVAALALKRLEQGFDDIVAAVGREVGEMARREEGEMKAWGKEMPSFQLLRKLPWEP